jgi:hypothetical protein
MLKLAPHQVDEVNEIIEKIQKAIKPKAEIGAQNRVILKSQLAVNKIKSKVMFFKAKREYSDEIVNYFVNEKKVARNRFHMNSQEDIYLVF